MEPIQIIGIKELDDMEIDAVNRLANRYFSKIQREIKKIRSIAINIKNKLHSIELWQQKKMLLRF